MERLAVTRFIRQILRLCVTVRTRRPSMISHPSSPHQNQSAPTFCGRNLAPSVNMRPWMIGHSAPVLGSVMFFRLREHGIYCEYVRCLVLRVHSVRAVPTNKILPVLTEAPAVSSPAKLWKQYTGTLHGIFSNAPRTTALRGHAPSI